MKRGEAFWKKPSGKKGQVSLFVIVGIVLLVVFGLVFYYRDLVVEKVLGPEGTRRMLSNQFENVKVEIESCIDRYAKQDLDKLGRQGSFELNNYVNYYGKNVEYLCTKEIGANGCVNHMFVISNLQEKLNELLKTQIASCVDRSKIEAGRFQVTFGTLEVSSNVEEEFVGINIMYPIKLTRSDISMEIKDFSKKIDIPLGRISYAVNDILNVESYDIYVDPINYRIRSNNLYVLNKYFSPPSTIYKIKTSYNDYEIWFAVQK